MTKVLAPDARRSDVESTAGVRLATYRWDPVGEPRAIVQLTHGMGEHAQRHGPLAHALTDAGYVVYAQDHRGHGETARSDAGLGEIGADGWDALVADIGRVASAAREENPGLRLVLLGHSMGSFAVQQHLLEHSDDLDAVVLSGTAALDLLEPALDLDVPMDLSSFNAPFEQRTGFEWLSRDEAQVDLYVDDPHCGFGLDAAAGKQMFVAARPLADPERLAAVRTDLPLLVAVGEHDPVNAQLALVNGLVDRLRDTGLDDVTLTVYPGARHEIFNETNRTEVFADVVEWIGARLG